MSMNFESTSLAELRSLASALRVLERKETAERLEASLIDFVHRNCGQRERRLRHDQRRQEDRRSREHPTLASSGRSQYGGRCWPGAEKMRRPPCRAVLWRRRGPTLLNDSHKTPGRGI